MIMVLLDVLFSSQESGTASSEARPTRLQLYAFIQTAYERGHLLETMTDQYVENWLKDSGQDMQDELYAMLKASKRRAVSEPAGGSYRVKVGLETPNLDPSGFGCTLSFTYAKMLMNTRVGIMVENGHNDWNFLLAIVPLDYKRILEQLQKDDLLEPLHGGGHTIIRQLKERLASPLKAVRTFLIFDSDRHHPAELDPSRENMVRRIPDLKQALELEDLARKHLPGRYWRLRRRAIENYLSLGDLEVLVQSVTLTRQQELKPRLKVFGQLKPEAQHFFPMKNGLAKQQADVQKWERSKDLYAHLSPEQLQLLQAGFGEKCFEETYDAVQKKGRSLEFDAEAQEEARLSLLNLWRLL